MISWIEVTITVLHCTEVHVGYIVGLSKQQYYNNGNILSPKTQNTLTANNHHIKAAVITKHTQILPHTARNPLTANADVDFDGVRLRL
jgi:hypothetical protein